MSLPGTAAALTPIPSTTAGLPGNSGRVRVGCSGFAGGIARYVRAFPVVEVQQTFYQPPQPRTLERWRREAPADFEFAIKAWQVITHAAASPTYRRLRDELSATGKRQAGRFRVNPTVMAAWQRTAECARLLRSRVILQIHDELLFEGPAEEAEQVRELACREMSGAFEMDPPLAVEAGTGADWLQAK